MPVIEINFLEANTTDNPHDESAIQLLWDEYNCGILILPNGPETTLFARNKCMLAVLDAYSSECDMPQISKEVHEEEGLAGLINISKFFLEKVAEHLTKCMEEFNNETSA